MSLSHTFESSNVTSPIAMTTTQMHTISNQNNTNTKSSYFMNVDGASNRRMLFEYTSRGGADSSFISPRGGMDQKEPEDGLNNTHDLSYADHHHHNTIRNNMRHGSQSQLEGPISISSRSCIETAPMHSSTKLKVAEFPSSERGTQEKQQYNNSNSRGNRLSKELSDRKMQQISLNFLDDPHEESLSIDGEDISPQAGFPANAFTTTTVNNFPQTLQAIDNSDGSKGTKNQQLQLQQLQQSQQQLMQTSKCGSPESRRRKRVGMTVIHPSAANLRRIGMNISTGNLLSFLQSNADTQSLGQKGMFTNQQQMAMMIMSMNNINNNQNNDEDSVSKKAVTNNNLNNNHITSQTNPFIHTMNNFNTVALLDEQAEPIKLRNQIMIFAFVIQFVKGILVRVMRRDFNLLTALQYRIIGDTSIAVDKNKIQLMQSVKHRNIFERINYIRSINAMEDYSKSAIKQYQLSPNNHGSNLKQKNLSPSKKSMKELFQSFQKEVLGNLKRKIVKVNLIKPNTPIMLAWEIFFLLLVFLLLIVIPLGIGFTLPAYIITILAFVNYVEVFAFSFDVFLGFHTGFYEFGEVVMNRKRIQKEYYEKKFVLNLLSIALVIVSILLDQPVCNFVALLLKIKSLIEKAETIDFNFQLFQKFTSIFALVKLFVMLLLMIHGFGCVFHLIGNSQTVSNGGQMDNWIENAGLQNAGLQEKYVNSIYFTIVTMVTIGYGDIHPVNIYEKLFVVGMAFISSVLFAFTVNLIGQIIAEMQKRSKEFRQKQFVMWSYMNEKQVKKSTQMRVLKYLEFVQDFSNASLEEGAKILESCSPDIKDELLREYFGRILKKTRVFRATFSKEFIAALSLRMKEKKFAPGEVLIHKGNHMTQLFFITKGSTEYFYANNEYHRNLCDLNEGLIDLRLFFSQQPSDISIRSKGITTAAYLDKETWHEVILQFPQDKEKECFLRDQFLNDQRFDYACKSCGQFRHHLFSCPQLNLIVKGPQFFRKMQMNSHQDERVSQARKSQLKSLRRSLQWNRVFAQKLKQLRWESAKEIYEDLDEIDADEESRVLESDRQFYMRCPKISASHLMQTHRMKHRVSSQAANPATGTIYNNNNINSLLHFQNQSLVELADTDNDTHNQMMYLNADHSLTSSLSSVSDSSSILNQNYFNNDNNNNNNMNINATTQSPIISAAKVPSRQSFHTTSGNEQPFFSQMSNQNSGEICESAKLKHNPNSFKSEDGGGGGGGGGGEQNNNPSSTQNVPSSMKRLQKRSHSQQHTTQSQSAAVTSLNLPTLTNANNSSNPIKAKVFLSKSNNHIEVMLESSNNLQENSNTIHSIDDSSAVTFPAQVPAPLPQGTSQQNTFSNPQDRIGIRSTSPSLPLQPTQKIISTNTNGNSASGYSVSVTPLQSPGNNNNSASMSSNRPTQNLKNNIGGIAGGSGQVGQQAPQGAFTFEDNNNNNSPRALFQKQQSFAGFGENYAQNQPNNSLNGILDLLQDLIHQFKDKTDKHLLNRQNSLISSAGLGPGSQQQNLPLRFKSNRYSNSTAQKRLSIQFEKQLTLQSQAAIAAAATANSAALHNQNQQFVNEGQGDRLPALSASQRPYQPSQQQQQLQISYIQNQRTPDKGIGGIQSPGIAGEYLNPNNQLSGSQQHLFGKCQFGFDSMREYLFYYPRFNYSNVVKAFKKLVQFKQIFLFQKDMGRSLSPEVYSKFLQNNLKRKFLKKTTFVRNKQ